MWFQKSAEQGNVNAQGTLGLCYESGWWGVSQNQVEAMKWFRMAAEQGNYGRSVPRLCYEQGQGVAQDYGEAVNWWRGIAEEGTAMTNATLGTTTPMDKVF